MSKRQLPELAAPDVPAGVDFRVPPLARAAFDPNVTAATKDDNTISILAEIGENWDGTGVTPSRIKGALRNIGEKPVTVQINSPGGNFFDGLAIYNMLRQHPEQVTVQVLGVAASAASIIAMAGDEIQVAKAGLMMVHNTQWIALGDRHVMTEVAEQMAIFDKTLAGLYADRTGTDEKQIAKWMDAETFMNGEDAVERGFADALLPADSVKVGNKADEPPHRRMAAALAKAGMPRAEIRTLFKELLENMPSADFSEPVMPSADDFNEGLARLRAASMRLRLTN